MAISFIGEASAATTSVTTPVHAIGDLILIFAYRTTTTAPSLPGGYTTVVTSSGNSNSFRVGYKIATATNDSSGTWTNASGVICVVYRGFGGISGIGASAGATKAASTTADIPTLSLQDTTGNSWVVAFAGSKQVVAQGTPLAGATQSRGTQTGTTFDIGAFDTNGGVASFAATTSSNNSSVTSSGVSIEILPVGVAASTLTDAFNDASIDGAKWESGTVGAGSTVVETTVLTETPAALTADAEGYLVGLGFNPKYNLTGDAFFVNLQAALAADANALTFSQVIADDNNNVHFTIGASPRTIRLVKVVAGVSTDVASASYNASTHAWIKIREASGTIFGDYSSDGISWTNLGSVANPFAITRVYPKLNAYANSVTTPGTAVWSAFNSSAVNASITQVAATVTAAGGAQVITAVVIASAAVTQVAANVTATGGIQVIAAAQKVAIAQLAATVTATGGTQVIATVNNAAITQLAATVTASGGTQVVATIRNSSIAQLAANVTAAGGTQVLGAAQTIAIAQIAASITATGGVQIVTIPVVVVYTPIVGILSTGIKTIVIDTTSLPENVASSGTIEEITTGQTDSEVSSTNLDETITTTGTETNI